MESSLTIELVITNLHYSYALVSQRPTLQTGRGYGNIGAKRHLN